MNNWQTLTVLAHTRQQVPISIISAGNVAAQLLRRNVKRFREGLVFQAHKLLYRSTLGLVVIQWERVSAERSAGVSDLVARVARRLSRSPDLGVTNSNFYQNR